ncbi:IS3 family transposase [Saccharopolyspora sp. NPDC000995]
MIYLIATRTFAWLAHRRPRWGFRRVHGELRRPGYKVSAATVRRVLRAAGFRPGQPASASTARGTGSSRCCMPRPKPVGEIDW